MGFQGSWMFSVVLSVVFMVLGYFKCFFSGSWIDFTGSWMLSVFLWVVCSVIVKMYETKKLIKLISEIYVKGVFFRTGTPLKT